MPLDTLGLQTEKAPIKEPSPGLRHVLDLWRGCRYIRQCLVDGNCSSLCTTPETPSQLGRHPAPTSVSRGAKSLRKGISGVKDRKARSPHARGRGSWLPPITVRNSKRFHDERPVDGFGFRLSSRRLDGRFF